MTLDHSALWSMYVSLEELRGKIGHVLKCAIQRSKVAWSNVIAKRCQRDCPINRFGPAMTYASTHEKEIPNRFV
jgi:hypothetical protein